MAKKKKRLTKKQRQQRELYKRSILCGFMFLVVLGLSYLIFISNILQPRVNDVTASYISFNNKNRTDMLRIDNLSKMSNKLGKSSLNDKVVNFKITGNNKKDYKIVIYPINNKINDKYINYVLLNDNKEISTNSLNDISTNDDGSKVIYEGKIGKSNKFTLRMWISNEYNDKVDNNSFEIKIK